MVFKRNSDCSSVAQIHPPTPGVFQISVKATVLRALPSPAPFYLSGLILDRSPSCSFYSNHTVLLAGPQTQARGCLRAFAQTISSAWIVLPPDSCKFLPHLFMAAHLPSEALLHSPLQHRHPCLPGALVCAGVGPRASHALGQCSTARLPPASLEHLSTSRCADHLLAAPTGHVLVVTVSPTGR